MRIVIGDNVERACQIKINEKHWTSVSSTEMIEHNYMYDNDRWSWGIEEIKPDASGHIKVYVGRDYTDEERAKGYEIQYKKMYFEVIHLDTIRICVQENMEEIHEGYTDIVSRFVEIGIQNTDKILYVQFMRKIENSERDFDSYNRYYFDKNMQPGGYTSGYITAPSWNQNRNREYIYELTPYFEAIYQCIPDLEKAFNLLIKNEN